MYKPLLPYSTRSVVPKIVRALTQTKVAMMSDYPLPSIFRSDRS